MEPLSRRTFLRQSLLGAAGFTALGLRGESSAAGQKNGSLSRSEQRAVENVVANLMSQHSVPGVSLAIAKEGRLVFRGGYGLADKASGQKVAPDSRFRIASVTKPFTSVTLFRLVEAGKLKITDKVFGHDGILGNDYGEPNNKWVQELRVVDLMTHTGGGWPNDSTDPMFRNPQMDHKELITWAVATIPLSHKPGTNYAYSNFGYCVLGRVIEKLTNQPYDTAVKELTLKPCGISGMAIAGDTLAQRADNEVVYYGQGGDNPYNMQVTRMDSHGGWIATAEDLVRFLVHVDGFPHPPDILSPETLAVMYASTSANPGYAKGWAVNRAPNYWHIGSLPGTTSLMVRTSTGLCWAALTNTRNAALDSDLDQMMWQVVGKVKTWPSNDLFKEQPAGS